MVNIDDYGRAATAATEHGQKPQYHIETEELGVVPDIVVVMGLLYEILKELRALKK